MRGLEGDSRFLLASGTDCLSLHPLKTSGVAVRNPQRLGALGFATLATLGFVFELFIVEEELLAGGKNEISSAIDTLQNLILELH